MCSGWVPIYMLPVSYPCFKLGKTQTHLKQEKLVKLGFVRPSVVWIEKSESSISDETHINSVYIVEVYL